MISQTIHNTLDTLTAKADAEVLTREDFDKALAVLRDAACDVRQLEMREVPPLSRVTAEGENVVRFPGPRGGDAA